MALMQKARLLESKKGGFKKPDITGFIPEGARDAVQRVVAAGMKIMFAPEARKQLMSEVNRKEPVPKKLAEAVTGLLLLLDQKSQGGIPVAAIFPAGMELLGEAAEVLVAAGQQVTQADYNEAAQMMFVLIGKKMGASEEQLMGAAEQALGAQAGGETEVDEQALPMPEETPDEEMA